MPGPKSKLEQDLELRLRLIKAPPWRRDYVFHPTRRWELDFAWPDILVYVSVEGGMGRSGHRNIANQYRNLRVDGTLVKVKVGSRDGYTEDLEKHTEAAILGWLGVRVTGPMIESGKAVELLKRAFAIRGTDPF